MNGLGSRSAGEESPLLAGKPAGTAQAPQQQEETPAAPPGTGPRSDAPSTGSQAGELHTSTTSDTAGTTPAAAAAPVQEAGAAAEPPSHTDSLSVSPSPAGAAASSSVQAAPASLSYLDFCAELEAALAQVEAEEAEKRAERDREALARFEPDTDPKAHWLARRFLDLQEEQARVEASYRSRMAAIEWDMHRLARRFEIPFTDWLRGALSASRKKNARSTRFDEGVIGFRAVSGGFRVKDAAALARWAEFHEKDPTAPKFGKYVTTYRYDLAALKAHAEATGELPDGLALDEPREVLYVASDLRDRSGAKVHRQINVSALAKSAPRAALAAADGGGDVVGGAGEEGR